GMRTRSAVYFEIPFAISPRWADASSMRGIVTGSQKLKATSTADTPISWSSALDTWVVPMGFSQCFGRAVTKLSNCSLVATPCRLACLSDDKLFVHETHEKTQKFWVQSVFHSSF